MDGMSTAPVTRMLLKIRFLHEDLKSRFLQTI